MFPEIGTFSTILGTDHLSACTAQAGLYSRDGIYFKSKLRPDIPDLSCSHRRWASMVRHILESHQWAGHEPAGEVFACVRIFRIRSGTGSKEISPQDFLLLLINLFMIIMDMIMDDLSVMLFTAPLLFPLFMKLGVHPFQMAAIMAVNQGSGQMTLPVAPIFSPPPGYRASRYLPS